ncbi:chloride channel protein [Petralouisia muris]|uniref:chloride channel protein n=1 Tax=Petralouisia muris TaxID=3032872 RepID=UPI0023B7F40A|nr:chloride channel protein [Petralouisia muris]
MNKSVRNNLYLILFCGIMGAVAGGVIWTFLKVMSLGITFLWEWLPKQVSIPYYTVLMCTAGGALIGCFRWKFGDYPEELDTVMGKIKAEKTYDYSNMVVLLLSALFPLLLGSSIGPEAGLTGVIVGLCYWVGDNLSFARQNAREYSQVGAAVTLGVLFRSPLFGVFAVEEENRDKEILKLPGTMKLFLYGLAAAAGTGFYMLLSELFGAGLSAMPSFPEMEPDAFDYLMVILYILLGCILAKFYFITHGAAKWAAGKIPAVAKETVGGLCLGVMGMTAPILMFSGEEAMGELIADYNMYLPLTLAAIAFLKVLLTNICIQTGLKGGHFFPVIFAGVCLGYAAAMIVFGNGAGHGVFAAATVTAALLGAIMKKPLAVTVLLFLCFPVRLFLWIFLAAAAGSFLAGNKEKSPVGKNKFKESGGI